jgi:hypothetical protein
MSLPHTTETVQLGERSCFKIAGKMYAVVALEPGDQDPDLARAQRLIGQAREAA